MTGVGMLRAPQQVVGSRVLWVECDADAAAGMEVELSVAGHVLLRARLLADAQDGRYLLGTAMAKSTVGSTVSVVFHLSGGTLLSFGWQ